MSGKSGRGPEGRKRMQTEKKGTALQFALLQDSNGAQWMPVYTDWQSFQKIYNVKGMEGTESQF